MNDRITFYYQDGSQDRFGGHIGGQKLSSEGVAEELDWLAGMAENSDDPDHYRVIAVIRHGKD